MAAHAEFRAAEFPGPGTSVLDEVLVTGERPGPGLWRVSKEGHDLWILGTLEPLPRGMSWHSDAVVERIAASQLVLAPPGVDPRVGFFRSLGLVSAVFHARKRPDGATLEQTLPHEVYMRWLALRVHYLGGSASDETLRPLLAAGDLYEHALTAVGLTDDDAVWQTVQKTARKHGVSVVSTTVEVRIDDPKGLLRELEHIPLDKEVDCLAGTIGRVESDIGPMRERANSWALGDVEGLLRARYPDDGMSCLNALTAVPALRQQWQSASAQARTLWFTKAQEALAHTHSTFAVLPLRHLTGAENWLPELASLGYKVVPPK